MPSTFTEDQTQAFEEGLEHVIKDNYFLPSENAFQLANSAFPKFAPELVILDETATKIYLAPYEKSWKGREGLLHMPGGWAVNKFRTIDEISNAVAKREIGVAVEAGEDRVLGVYWWTPGEHDFPKSRPLSLYVLAKPRGPIPETANGAFYAFADLPGMHDKLINGAHAHFLLNPEPYLAVAHARRLL